MTIHAIHSYLVHPAKHADEQPALGGTELLLEGRLFDMLADVYRRSDGECNIDISFDHNAQGAQQNDARDLIVQYLRSPSLDSGRQLASRLQRVTTHRSGLGLLFLIASRASSNRQLVVSRFPADHGILAEERRDGLTVEFLERIFMKSATAYKAALYNDASLEHGFWDGRCVDKQINSNVLTISNYWIKEFLQSDFKTTSAQGTRRLAVALRSAISATSDLGVKEELSAAGRLAGGQHGRTISARAFGTRFGFSEAATEAFQKQFRPASLYTEQFTLSRTEFSKHVAFASIELDNGGILTADAARFDDVFAREEMGEQTRFSTEGRIVNQKLRQKK